MRGSIKKTIIALLCGVLLSGSSCRRGMNAQPKLTPPFAQNGGSGSGMEGSDAAYEDLDENADERLEKPAPLKGKSEMILARSGYVISYNVQTKCPNYVAWKLSSSRTRGPVKRTDNFQGDPRVEERYRIETQDYSGSGYDRGHMCPAGDNKHSLQSMTETFYMTNICPQNANLNKGDWNVLEEQCRYWARNYGDIYVVCGPIFDSDQPARIGRRKNFRIAVPDRFFKVVLMMGSQPKAIGFVYPNSDTNRDIRDYCVSVDEVEEITGIDFYPNLPDKTEKVVEKMNNPASWGI